MVEPVMPGPQGHNGTKEEKGELGTKGELGEKGTRGMLDKKRSEHGPRGDQQFPSYRAQH